MAQAMSGAATLAAHDAAAQAIEALHLIEVHEPNRPAPSRPQLRVATWNLERCKHVEAAAALLRRCGAELVLLSEMDLGMARSGQRHTTRDLAQALGFGYAFGVEFVELGHGLGRELDCAGQPNAVGLHGNAILSAFASVAPVLIRLERPGAWFQRDWHHRRIGGRIGLAETLQLGGCAVPVLSTHLENISSPEDRRRQTDRILDWLASQPRDCPAMIAGDFNTAELPDADPNDRHWYESADVYEPLFGALGAAGFDWRTANRAEHTRRHIADGRPLPKLKRVDWFFTRGLDASNPQSWPAVDASGQTISDHELITVDIAMGTRR